MGTMRSILISAGDTWVAPLTVSGVFLYEVGGGSGAGSAEFCGGRPITVVPGDSYVVVVGTKGLGAEEPGLATPGGYSLFAGLKALEGGVWRGGNTGADSAGRGGGTGGGIPVGSGDNGTWPANQPVQEAMHYWGGASGSGGPPLYTGTGPNSSGGALSAPGADIGGLRGGGGSGGSIWGTTDGADAQSGPPIPNREANADPTHYGCGAGGTGGGDVGGSDGGDGAGGAVVLIWFQ